MSLVPRQETHSKIDAAYATLEERITSGRWEIGEVIPREGELAAELGCSRDTVSKAIARLVHAGLVERRTRAGTRVLRNTPLAAGGSGSVPVPAVELDAFAFIFPSKRHEGVRRVMNGFQDAADEAGRRVMMLSTGADYQKEAEFITRLQEFDVKGAVIYPALAKPEDILSLSQMLLASRYPIVLAEVNLPGFGRPAIVVDGFHAGYTMTKYLIGKGAQKIGFVSNYSWTTTMRDKYQGYHRALQEAGLPEPAKGVMMDPGMHPNFSDPLDEPTQIGRHYLAGGTDADAVVCADDYLAAGLATAARETGRRIPEDIKLGSLNECLTGHPFTSYRVPYEQMGREAFTLLDAVQQGSQTLPVSGEKQLQGTIMERNST
ncbi:transcriptional regulator [Opitutaceae bacterium TAV1]|nr:transcriptional regulator [Opitutaceae bacterium TAV1]